MRTVVAALLLSLASGCAGLDTFEPDTTEDIDCSDWFLRHRTLFPNEFPRRVLLAEDLPDEFAQAISDGAQSWNDTFSFDVFSVERADDELLLHLPVCGWETVAVKDLEPAGRRGIAFYDSCFARIMLDPVQMPDKQGRSLLPIVAKHELGHTLGLPHVEDPHDLMNRYTAFVDQYDSVSPRERCLVKTAFLNQGKTLEPR